jgi:DNA-binding GntR family transcriptional regulator
MAQFKTETDKVYELIRNDILLGKLSPGEHLPQRKLAERYQATTITVREALRVLESEGIVFIKPKWGAMVEDITPEKLYGKYIVREALEGMAAKLACGNINDGEKVDLLDMANELDVLLNDDAVDREQKAKMHYSMHDKISHLTRCPELINFLKNINLHTIIFRNAYYIDWHDANEGWHTKLAKAITSGNTKTAESVMREHIRRGYEMESEALGKNQINKQPTFHGL